MPSPKKQPDRLKTLSVVFGRDGFESAVAAFRGLNPALPAGGRYLVRLEGNKLVIGELTSGIQIEELPDSLRRAGKVTQDGLLIRPQIRGSGLTIIKKAPVQPDPDAMPAEAGPVLGLIDEFNALKNKQYPPGKEDDRNIDSLRMAELVREIQSRYHPLAPSEEETRLKENARMKREQERAAKVREALRESAQGASKVSRE